MYMCWQYMSRGKIAFSEFLWLYTNRTMVTYEDTRELLDLNTNDFSIPPFAIFSAHAQELSLVRDTHIV